MSNWDHLGNLFFVGMDPGTIDPPEQFEPRRPGESIFATPIRARKAGAYDGIRYQTATAFDIILNNSPTEEERQEMAWTNTEAAGIAREILAEQRKEGLRDEVTAAVAQLQEMIAGTKCGSVFTFRKTNEENGKHYWYAAIKNGGKWYTTAQNPRILPDDETFIEWLITLEAWKSEGLELTAGSIPERPMLEATAVES